MSRLISYSFCLVVIALVAYAFSPREQTDGQQVSLDLARLQINDLARLDERVIAVGERGTIIVSDDLGDSWRATHSDEDLPVTLTGISPVGGNTLLAYGHYAVLMSRDDGAAHMCVLVHGLV